MRQKPDQFPGDELSSETADSEYYVLGGGHVGVFVARRLQADGHTVSLVDPSHSPSEIPVLRGDPADIRTLNKAGVSDASAVIVATSNDGRKLLIAQLICTHFDVPRIIVLVSVPHRLDLVAEAGHEPICATTALSEALVDSV